MAVSMQRGLKGYYLRQNSALHPYCLNAKRIERRRFRRRRRWTCKSRLNAKRIERKLWELYRERAVWSVSMAKRIERLLQRSLFWLLAVLSQCKEDWKSPQILLPSSSSSRSQCKEDWKEFVRPLGPRKVHRGFVSMQRGLKVVELLPHKQYWRYSLNAKRIERCTKNRHHLAGSRSLNAKRIERELLSGLLRLKWGSVSMQRGLKALIRIPPHCNIVQSQCKEDWKETEAYKWSHPDSACVSMQRGLKGSIQHAPIHVLK